MSKKKKKEAEVKPDCYLQTSHLFVDDVGLAQTEERDLNWVRSPIKEKFPVIFASEVVESGESDVINDYKVQSIIDKWADIVVILVNDETQPITNRKSLLFASAAANTQTPKTTIVLNVGFIQTSDDFLNLFNNKIKELLISNHLEQVDKLFLQRIPLKRVSDDEINKLQLVNGTLQDRK